MNVRELAKESHEIAVSKGWWESPRTPQELAVLCISELSEAVEAYRDNPDDMHRVVNGKPEGIAVELADYCIRLLDWQSDSIDINKDGAFEFVNTGETDLINVVYMLTGYTMEIEDYSGESLFKVFGLINNYMLSKGYDLEVIIKEKLAYNKTRPHRHGGKAL